MKAPTTEFKLQMSGVVVHLRKWITNEQADYVEEPILDAVQLKTVKTLDPKKPDVSMAGYDTKNAVHVGARRKRQVFTEKLVVPAEGETAEKTITDQGEISDFFRQLPSTDIELLDVEIEKLEADNKKKLEPQPALEPTPTAG